VERVDLLVVGAGPAGIAAGIAAHARGLRTTVVDKATFPRDKTCGDGLTVAALRWYERLGFDAPGVKGFQPVHDVVVRSPSGRLVDLELPDDGLFACVVPRLELDAAFAQHAKAVGVDLRSGWALDIVDTRANGVVARSIDGAEIHADYVIGADGHWSRLRRLTTPEPTAGLSPWHAERWYVRGYDDTTLRVLFERDLFPGYVWVFPLPDGRANVGWMVERGVFKGRDLESRWREVVSSDSLHAVLDQAEIDGPRRAWPIPRNYSRDQLAHGRCLFTGDAASVVDPLTGEGIAQALESGVLAVESIVAGGDVAARYTRRVDRAIGRDLRFAALLARILSWKRREPDASSPIGAKGAARVAGLSPWTRRHFARWLFEDYPRALLFTPDRWHRGMLAGPGAYR
jgi:geranylgeranyl reductase family protein